MLAPHTMILLEENIGISLHDLGFGNGLLNMAPKAQQTKIDELDFIQCSIIIQP